MILEQVGTVPEIPTDVDPATRARMQRVARRDTKPELAVRRILHAHGFRYFVDRSPMKGMRSRADLVFPRPRVAVFVDGCFWHSCPTHATTPARNREWWAEKLAENVSRDRRVDQQLIEHGWLSVRIWEHVQPETAAAEIEQVIRARRTG